MRRLGTMRPYEVAAAHTKSACECVLCVCYCAAGEFPGCRNLRVEVVLLARVLVELHGLLRVILRRSARVPSHEINKPH